MEDQLKLVVWCFRLIDVTMNHYNTENYNVNLMMKLINSLSVFKLKHGLNFIKLIFLFIMEKALGEF